MRVLIDTNVVLDFVLARQPFFIEADEIFVKFQNTEFETFVSAITPINVFYTTHKERDKAVAFQAVEELLNIVKVAEINKLILQNAFSLGFSDFEDAVQCASAIAHELDAIITRNIKDYGYSPIAVYSPADFLAKLNSE